MKDTTKAGIIVLLNAAMGLAVAFHVALDPTQQGAVITFANAVLGLWVIVTARSNSGSSPGTR